MYKKFDIYTKLVPFKTLGLNKNIRIRMKKIRVKKK